MPVVFASITDPLVQFAVDVVDAMGLGGVFLLMLFESACIPIPSEATMLFAGFNVSDGEYSLIAAVTVGVAANVVGSWIAYAVGYFGRIDILEKHGKKLHVKPSHLAWADRWFERYGDATVFFSRMLPIIRTFISLPAGVARMPFWRFTLFTTLGCIPWIFMLTFVGEPADRLAAARLLREEDHRGHRQHRAHVLQQTLQRALTPGRRGFSRRGRRNDARLGHDGPPPAVQNKSGPAVSPALGWRI